MKDNQEGEFRAYLGKWFPFTAEKLAALELELSARDEEIKRLREALQMVYQADLTCCQMPPEQREQCRIALNPNSGVKQAFPNGRF